ncbi:MAG: signal recognition particle protein Srp19 [Thermoprotei archaeon]
MSRDYKGERIVVYPQYLDAKKTRREGRRLSRDIAIPHPKVEEIVKAAEMLGLDPIVEESKYPREWWETSKRIVVKKVDSKLNTLKLIAQKIRELRGILK